MLARCFNNKDVVTRGIPWGGRGNSSWTAEFPKKGPNTKKGGVPTFRRGMGRKPQRGPQAAGGCEKGTRARKPESAKARDCCYDGRRQNGAHEDDGVGRKLSIASSD